MADIVLDRELIGKPKQKYWVSYILQRIKKNKNFLGFISGQTGSGKSWSSLSIAASLDPEFNIDRVVFSGLELMQLVNSGTLKRGSCIVFEEAGVELNNRQWQSTTNKMINYLTQTFRHRGFILILNSPYMDFVDSATKKLFHAEFRMAGINFKTNEGLLKPQLIQYNSRMQKFYYKRLKVITREGSVPIDTWKVLKPAQALIDAYEQKKQEYTQRLNNEILSELMSVNAKQQKNNAKNNAEVKLTDIQREVVDKLQAGLLPKQISEARGRSLRNIYECMTGLKKKGIKFTRVYENGRLIKYTIEGLTH